MEILSKGKLPEEETCIWSCKHCKSKMKAKKSEGMYQNHRNESYWVFKCPVCKRENFIETPDFS